MAKTSIIAGVALMGLATYLFFRSKGGSSILESNIEPQVAELSDIEKERRFATEKITEIESQISGFQSQLNTILETMNPSDRRSKQTIAINQQIDIAEQERQRFINFLNFNRPQGADLVV